MQCPEESRLAYAGLRTRGLRVRLESDDMYVGNERVYTVGGHDVFCMDWCPCYVVVVHNGDVAVVHMQ